MGHRTFMYHAEHGARIFDSDDLPSAADGWTDDYKALENKNQLAKKPAKKRFKKVSKKKAD